MVLRWDASDQTLHVGVANVSNAPRAVAMTRSIYPRVTFRVKGSAIDVPYDAVDVDADDSFWATKLSDFIFVHPGTVFPLCSGTFARDSEMWRFINWSMFEDYSDHPLPAGAYTASVAGHSGSSLSGAPSATRVGGAPFVLT